jgi:small-conductance mechanosensitive channel
VRHRPRRHGVTGRTQARSRIFRMQNLIDRLGESHLAGISYFDWGLALVAMVAAYLAMMLALRVARDRLRAFTARTKNGTDDVIVNVLASTNRGLLLAAAVLIGIGTLDLGARWSARVDQAWFVAVALQLALWLNRGTGVAVRAYEVRHGRNNGQLSASGTLLSWFLRTLLWVVIVLAILSNLGVNITAFVASLGVGGIALALAVQNILGDLFASLSIAVDKPFEVGDFIISDAGLGTVEYVGLKTTRIRALSGEQIVVGNTDLLKQPVKNFRRMQERRIVFGFRIARDTPPDLVEAIPAMVRKLVQADTLLRFDRAHFQGFGDSSLDFEVVYYVLDPDYNRYMDAQQRVNLGLLRAFADHGIQLAYPSRTLYVAQPGVTQEMLPATAQ